MEEQRQMTEKDIQQEFDRVGELTRRAMDLPAVRSRASLLMLPVWLDRHLMTDLLETLEESGLFDPESQDPAVVAQFITDAMQQHAMTGKTNLLKEVEEVLLPYLRGEAPTVPRTAPQSRSAPVIYTGE